MRELPRQPQTQNKKEELEDEQQIHKDFTGSDDMSVDVGLFRRHFQRIRLFRQRQGDTTVGRSRHYRSEHKSQYR